MNFIIKRRQLILATLVVALGAAVFVNWYYTGNNSLQSAEETTDAEYVRNLGEAEYVNAEAAVDYFTEARLNRTKTQDEAVDKLNESLKNAEKGSDEAKALSASVSALSEQIKLQGDIEALITAKVSGECIVVLSDESAQVIVEKGKLNEDTALQIMDIVTKNTGFEPSAVTVTEAK